MDAGPDGAQPPKDSGGDAPADGDGPEAGPCDAGSGDWMTDGCLWVAESEAAECEVHRAKLPSGLVPTRPWTACGPGCQVGPTALGDLPYAQYAEATERGGEIYYRSSFGSPVHSFDALHRLSDDTPITLFRSKRGSLQPGGCSPHAKFGTPHIFGWAQLGGMSDPLAPLHFAATSTTLGGPASWVTVPPDERPMGGSMLFAFDGGFGLVDSNALVKAWLTPGSSVYTKIYASQSYQLAPVGRGPLVAWVDWGDHTTQSRAHIRSWTKAGGTQILVGGVPEYDAMGVALSDTKIVWLGATGPGSVQGDTQSVALFWSPFTASPADVVRHTGTGTLPHSEHATGPVVTHGDLAATTVSYLGDGGAVAVHVIVANLITGQIWEIPSRPNNLFGKVMAMNATTLLVQETTLVPNYLPIRIIRLDLGQLDALTQGLQ